MTNGFLIHPTLKLTFYMTQTRNTLVICTDGFMKGQIFHVNLETGITSPVVAYDQEYTVNGLKILKAATEVAEAVVKVIDAVKAGHYKSFSVSLIAKTLADNLDAPTAYED